MEQPNRPAARPTPVRAWSLRLLLVIPVLLALATGLLLFVHSDVNVAMLYSQCHARSRLQWLSRIPVLGAPSCFLVSFFQFALASARSFAVMSVVLSFVAGLLTVTTVESARLCNGPSVLIAYPTGAWLVFNLLGGAIVWELVIIPAFLHRAKRIQAAERTADHTLERAHDPDVGDARRHLAGVAEVAAIPVAVALGFVAPSLAMLILGTPATIIVWLFFPIYVSLLRQLVRPVARSAVTEHRSLHLESHRPSLVAVYAVPVACSALSHALLIWNLFQADDRKEMTRATLKFIEIDFAFIALTVLYWLFVEAGWRVALIMVGATLVLGPGAGVCIGWRYREERFGTILDHGDGDEDATVVGEESPLLQ